MTATLEGAGLSAEQLDELYNADGDGEHPQITRATWREAVSKQETVSGYWPWLSHTLEQRGHNAGAALAQVTAPAAEPGPHFVVILEDARNLDLLVRAKSTAAEAEAFRLSFTNDRTSPIVEVPASLANQPGFYAAAEALVRATLELELTQASDGPESDNEEEPCEVQ